MAIFRAHRQTLKKHGITIAVEVWDEDAGCFPFDWSRLVKMTASRKRSEEERKEAGHNAPWTIAGREALMHID